LIDILFLVAVGLLNLVSLVALPALPLATSILLLVRLLLLRKCPLLVTALNHATDPRVVDVRKQVILLDLVLLSLRRVVRRFLEVLDARVLAHNLRHTIVVATCVPFRVGALLASYVVLLPSVVNCMAAGCFQVGSGLCRLLAEVHV